MAALLIRWNFYEWFNQVDPGKTFATQGVFSTSPGPGMSVLGGLAQRDHRHGPAADADPGHHRRPQHRPGANLAPFIIGLAVVVIGMSLGAAVRVRHQPGP